MITKDEAQNLLQDFLKIESITPDVADAFDFLERLFIKYNFEVQRVKFKSDDSFVEPKNVPKVSLLSLTMIKLSLSYKVP